MSSFNKEHQWKRILNRKSQIESPFQSTVSKRKYTPIKDTSMSNSRVFERSRERQKSKSSIKGLNQSRDKSSNSKLNTQRSHNKMIDSADKGGFGSDPSLINSINRTSDAIKIGEMDNSIIKGQNMAISNVNLKPVYELQKQFRNFKDKITKQLQRQSEYLNQMVKEIILTFQYEMSKLQANTNNQTKIQDPQPNRLKQYSSKLQELKLKTSKFQLGEKSPSKSTLNSLRSVKSEKSLSQPVSTPILNSKQIKFDRFFDLINKLKTDFVEMHQVAVHSPVNSPLNSPRNSTRQPQKYQRK